MTTGPCQLQPNQANTNQPIHHQIPAERPRAKHPKSNQPKPATRRPASLTANQNNTQQQRHQRIPSQPIKLSKNNTQRTKRRDKVSRRGTQQISQSRNRDEPGHRNRWREALVPPIRPVNPSAGATPGTIPRIWGCRPPGWSWACTRRERAAPTRQPRFPPGRPPASADPP